MNQVSASIPIRVQRQNYYATLAVNVQNTLSQTYDTTTNTCVPDWSNAANAAQRPVLTPVISCPIAYTLSSVEWYRDGVLIGTATGGAVVSGFSIDPTTGALTITDNLASVGNVDPDTFTCKVKIIVANVTYDLERMVSATILPASADGYSVIVRADRTALSSAKGETTTNVICDLYYKGVLQNSDGAFKWFRGATELSNFSANTIKVYRDAVAGSANNEDRGGVDWEQLYRCEVRVNNVLQGVGSIVITDQADNYCLQYNISGDVTDTTPATIHLQLMQRKTDASAWTNFGHTASYTADLLDIADNSQLPSFAIGNLDSTGKGSFQVTEADMDNAQCESGIINVVASW